MTATRPGTEHGSPAAQGCPADVTRLYEPTPPHGREHLWHQLRAQHGPVAPVELEPGVRAWVLLGYQENLTALQRPRLFTRDTRNWSAAVDGLVDLDKTVPLMTWLPNALFVDGAEHTRLRAPVLDGMARVDLTAMGRDTRRIANDLVDSFTASGSADLIGEYAAKLPILVINRLFGLPDSYGYMLGDLTTAIFSEDTELTEDTIVRMQQYFAGLVARKADEPGPDLASWMIGHPAGLTPHELAHQASLLVSAGHMTTTHLIGNTMRTLLTDDRIRSAHTDARLSTNDLLDHVMWTEPPLQLMAGRIALQDVRIGDTLIRAGDALYIGTVAAHQDPAVRKGQSDPDTGLASGSRAHLSLGAGPHSCPARALGRMVASTGVSVLQERLAELRLSVPPEELRRATSPFLHGLRELPVSFRPGRPSDPAPARTEQMEQIQPAAEEDQPPEDLLGKLLKWWRNLAR